MAAMGKLTCRLAVCTLNQWTLDFDGNLARIRESILASKAAGARYRLGPELETTSYSAEDHFFESDTLDHSWEIVAELIADPDLTMNIVCDIGAPVMHYGVRYNCRIIVCNRRVELIRPKRCLANDGNYRETRYFAAWDISRGLEKYILPSCVTHVNGQAFSNFGEAILEYECGATTACECCEELFTPNASHIQFALQGCDIVANGSGSHHQLRKLKQRIDLLSSATAKAGGVYLYSNLRGCDGNRTYFDGSSMIALNGNIIQADDQFKLGQDVSVIAATVDLHRVRSYRSGIASVQAQAAKSSHEKIPRLHVEFKLCFTDDTALQLCDRAHGMKYVPPEEEIALGPACWLWDYLRRSKARGFLLPLSGGADSSAVATIVGIMCQLVYGELQEGNLQVAKDLKSILRLSTDTISTLKERFQSPQDVAKELLTCAYLKGEASGSATEQRANRLSNEIGAKFITASIVETCQALMSSASTALNTKKPSFRSEGGTVAEDLARQNVQARSRMVLAFMLAQMRGAELGGFILVLGAANVDEALRGYMTKYDCSSADLNPIGGISKTDLKSFLSWAASNKGYPSLQSIVEAPPTAELVPDNEVCGQQTDEADMGMTYSELSRYGRLRKQEKMGPVSMFRALYNEWKLTFDPSQVADKVKHFFRSYAINRHKSTVLTPSYHAESYSPDDNRFDLRPFLYNVQFPYQFRKIDEIAEKLSNLSG